MPDTRRISTVLENLDKVGLAARIGDGAEHRHPRPDLHRLRVAHLAQHIYRGGEFREVDGKLGFV